MCPIAGRRMNATGTLIGHVLAVETAAGALALVDTGIGLRAVEDLRGWLGRAVADVFRPEPNPAHSAVHRLRALGYEPSDVSDVFVTHLDADHAGGLADFPHATVHVHERELAAVQTPGADINARVRYQDQMFAHGPRWSTYGADGEAWFGFEAARPVLDGIVAIPLPGHTRGHSAIAVQGDDGWLLHAGDAYYHASVIRPELGRQSRYLRAMTVFNAAQPRRVFANQDRLRELHARGEVSVFCAHDPWELDHLR